ncbi:MAG: lema protein LemA protein [Candidatus Taylorbacteria bacterium]|nr:lema protein LemA protein [Candidatus Taylorbacteria bacterium]
MKTSSKAWIVVGIIAVLVLIYGFSAYNKFVAIDEQATAQWKQVETQYQRRYDLIPNLVEVTKGVMKQEQAVFGAIADARTRYAGAQTSGSIDDKAKAASQLDSAIGRLLVITENYPQLKSSENVQSLVAEIAGTENRISVERSRFNSDIQAYNVLAKRFPSSIIAAMFGFHERPYFQADAEAAKAPKITM